MSMTNPVVGRDSTAITPDSGLITNQMNPAGKVPSSPLLDTINSKLDLKGITIDGTPVGKINFAETLSDIQLVNIAKQLKIRGLNFNASKKEIKKIITDDSVLSKFASESTGGYADFMQKLQEDYLPGLDKQPAPNLPTRQINEYQPEVLNKLIDSVYKSVVKKPPTDAQRATELAKLQQQISEGTVTTTSQVKNAKTGKLENVTKTSAGFSQAAAEANIAAGIKATNPDAVDAAKRAEFSSWLTQNVAGA
jgi:hypothetical protein